MTLFIHTHFCLFFSLLLLLVSLLIFVLLSVTVLFVHLLVFVLGDGIHGSSFGFCFKIRRESC